MLKIEHNNKIYTIDTKNAIDISIPYNFNGKQPNFYGVNKGTLKPLETNDTFWSVEKGASCNVPEISMNIHCTGTHTEYVGHLLKNHGDIGNILLHPFLSSILISVESTDFVQCHDYYHCNIQNNEKVVTKDAIKTKLKKWEKYKPSTLIIRTMPNNDHKKSLKYDRFYPTFLTNNALQYIVKNNIKHLIVDLPSVDRMNDNGILGNHRIFWGNGINPNGNINPNSKKTITELAYIPNSVIDGFYFVNIQIPHFACDAAPSRPLLFKPINDI